MLILLLDLYSLVLLASVVLSWVQVSDDNAFVKIVRQLTEPVLEPVRKIVPPVGGFDLSPVLVILALNLLKALLYRI
jgi:YggT family protein